MSFYRQPPPPSVKVVSVDSLNVIQPPTGSLMTPDVTINTNSGRPNRYSGQLHSAGYRSYVEGLL